MQKFAGILAVLFFLAAAFAASALFVALEKKEQEGRPEKEREGVSAALEESGEDAARAASAVIAEVIDGDTVVLQSGETVRLLGVDADELGDACYGEARAFLSERILGEDVLFVAGAEDRDRYGRLLRYAFHEGENISEILAAEGFAEALLYPQNRLYREEIISAERIAREERKGCEWRTYEGLTALKQGAVKPCDAAGYVGERVRISGAVASAYRDDESGTVFLNFGAPYPNQCFTAVIFRQDGYRFPAAPEEMYDGRNVHVEGTVTRYRGAPQIILEYPEQIAIRE